MKEAINLLLVIVSTLDEVRSDIVPQLTLVVVVVPGVDGRVKESLEGKGTGEDCGHKNGVSLDQSRELEVSMSWREGGRERGEKTR